ncbi:MAG: hypothetical protein N2747_00440 [Chitinophagaceae bacterium]|nr:hypothetical protein [Chitinophagaceae bacterium]
MNDILIDNEGKIKTQHGDFRVGESDGQHMALLLMTHPGEWVEHPTTGVGLSDMVLDDDLLYWEHEIADQFRADGVIVSKIKLTQENLDLDAHYNDTKR